MTVHLSAADRAVWQCDVDECDDCQGLPGEDRLCPDHDLDDEDVARRYSGSGGEDEDDYQE